MLYAKKSPELEKLIGSSHVRHQSIFYYVYSACDVIERNVIDDNHINVIDDNHMFFHCTISLQDYLASFGTCIHLMMSHYCTIGISAIFLTKLLLQQHHQYTIIVQQYFVYDIINNLLLLLEAS